MFREVKFLGHAAAPIAGLGIYGNTHQVISGTVDEIAVGIGLKIAAAGVVRDAVKDRHVVDCSGGFFHRKKTLSLDRHIGGNGRDDKNSLCGDELLSKDRTSSSHLPA